MRSHIPRGDLSPDWLVRQGALNFPTSAAVIQDMNSYKATSTFLLMSLSALAYGAGDRIILANREAIDQACRSAGSSESVVCKFIPATDIDRATPDSHLWVEDAGACNVDYGVGLSVPRARLSFLEWGAGNKYCAQALIYPRVDSNGQQYFMARMVVLSAFQRDPPHSVDGKDDIAWEAFSRILSNDQPEGDASKAYLSQLDDAAREHEAAIAAAKAQANSEKAYLDSDEYKRSQAEAAIASCRQAITAARRAIKQDERVAQISGYENKLLKEQAAVTIVQCEDVIALGSAPRR